MFSHNVSDSLQQYDAFRELWRRRGSLARAAAKYAQATGDFAFSLQEMLREHYEWPIPGLWDSLRVEPDDEVSLSRDIREALADQRLQFLAGRGKPFHAIVRLQQQALESARTPRLGIPADCSRKLIAEACYKNLVLLSRMLVEQAAMREALHFFGGDRPADDLMVTTLRRSSDIVLNELDLKLEGGMLLEDTLAVEVELEAV